MQAMAPLSVPQQVLTYIQAHLDGDLSLDRLARFSGYSGYHLHRCIREEVGEPIGLFIKRKRIEAAAMMLGLTDQPISAIHPLVGYEDSAAFARAFRQVMGCSPREFRRQPFFQQQREALPAEYLSLNYRLVRLPAWRALAFPAIADYFSPELLASWEPVRTFLAQGGIASSGLRFRGVIHECPNITGRTRCRYDATLSLAEGPSPADVFPTEYPGGRYAVFRFCAPYDCLKSITLRVTEYVLSQTDLRLRPAVSFLEYLDSPLTHAPDHLLTEWYLPVE